LLITQVVWWISTLVQTVLFMQTTGSSLPCVEIFSTYTPLCLEHEFGIRHIGYREDGDIATARQSSTWLWICILGVIEKIITFEKQHQITRPTTSPTGCSWNMFPDTLWVFFFMNSIHYKWIIVCKCKYQNVKTRRQYVE